MLILISSYCVHRTNWNKFINSNFILFSSLSFLLLRDKSSLIPQCLCPCTINHSVVCTIASAFFVYFPTPFLFSSLQFFVSLLLHAHNLLQQRKCLFKAASIPTSFHPHHASQIPTRNKPFVKHHLIGTSKEYCEAAFHSSKLFVSPLLPKEVPVSCNYQVLLANPGDFPESLPLSLWARFLHYPLLLFVMFPAAMMPSLLCVLSKRHVLQGISGVSFLYPLYPLLCSPCISCALPIGHLNFIAILKYYMHLCSKNGMYLFLPKGKKGNKSICSIKDSRFTANCWITVVLLSVFFC